MLTKQLLRSAHPRKQGGESSSAGVGDASNDNDKGQEEEEEEESESARFLRKAVRGLRRTLSTNNTNHHRSPNLMMDKDGASSQSFRSTSSTDGYIRHMNDETVVFTAMKDLEFT